MVRFQAPSKSRESPPETSLAIENVGGTRIVVLPGVFNGIRYHTGAFLADSLTTDVIPRASSVLDLGTGSGVCAVFAGRLAHRVVAIDINPEAVRCATINILIHHLEETVEARTGDLFAAVAGERFDVILFNPPYFHGVPRNATDHAQRSPDVFSRFLRELHNHLTPGGRALVVLSPDTDIEGALHSARDLSVSTFTTRQVLDKTLTIYEVRPT